jgi:hypothetical protein
MNKSLPDGVLVNRLARRAAEPLNRRGQQLEAAGPMIAANIRGLFVDLWEDSALSKRGDEVTRQRYLALTALHRSLVAIAPAQVDPRWQPALRLLDEELKTSPRR